MKTIKIILLVFVVVIFTSCDCLQHVQGTIIDAETRQPIGEVTIKKNINVIILTDSTGNFEFTTMTSGLFGCQKISLSFDKEGYIKTRLKYKSCCTNGTIVVLEKKQNK